MLAQLDAESVVLEVVKGTSLTGPATAATETKDRGDALIINDGRSTSELCASVRTGKLAVMAVIRELGYSNFAQGVCRRCSPSNGRQPGKHLCRTEKGGDVKDETWVHRYDPMTKRHHCNHCSRR
jgi:hypothetical protein